MDVNREGTLANAGGMNGLFGAVAVRRAKWNIPAVVQKGRGVFLYHISINYMEWLETEVLDKTVDNTRKDSQHSLLLKTRSSVPW